MGVEDCVLQEIAVTVFCAGIDKGKMIRTREYKVIKEEGNYLFSYFASTFALERCHW